MCREIAAIIAMITGNATTVAAILMVRTTAIGTIAVASSRKEVGNSKPPCCGGGLPAESGKETGEIW